VILQGLCTTPSAWALRTWINVLTDQTLLLLVLLYKHKLMLITMQNMQYFIITGFGISKSPCFGGSDGDLLMSLGQGI
jgi:hypothetical protein